MPFSAYRTLAFLPTCENTRRYANYWVRLWDTHMRKYEARSFDTICEVLVTAFDAITSEHATNHFMQNIEYKKSKCYI